MRSMVGEPHHKSLPEKWWGSLRSTHPTFQQKLSRHVEGREDAVDGQLRKLLLTVGWLALLGLTGCASHCSCGGAPNGQSCGSECCGPAGYCGEIPRFHPVPTQPVFAPRSYAAALYPQAAGAEAIPPGPATPLPAEKMPSASMSRPIPASPGVESKSSTHPAAPRQLEPSAVGGGSWVFSAPLPPALLRSTEPSVDVKADSPDNKGKQKQQ